MSSALGRVLVVGTGLIGTSIALALRERGVEVLIDDIDPGAVADAVALGAGRAASEAPADPMPTLAVVAVPPTITGRVVADILTGNRARFATDVASVKGLPVADIAAAGVADRYVGGHPMAGREVSGARAARSDLFVGRPWVLCPTPATAPGALDQVTTLAVLVGATPLVMPAHDHDAAVALVSHAPHLMSALVAGRLASAADHEVRLAGPGVTDVTRIAGSDPTLWVDILTANRSAVHAVLVAVRDDLDRALAALSGDGSPQAVAEILGAGVAGRGRLPGKHGHGHEVFVVVPVPVEDRPGQLARLFADIDAAQVNVEDIAIDHVPGVPVGVVEVSVLPDAVAPLIAALTAQGWDVEIRSWRASSARLIRRPGPMGAPH